MSLKVSELINLLKKRQRDIPAEIIEKLELYADKTTQELMNIQSGDVQQQQLGPCECKRLVPFCCEVQIPSYINPIDNLSLSGLSFDTSCVECIIDKCTVPLKDIPNPCNPNTPFPSIDITFNALRFVGCIRHDVSVLAVEFVPFFNGSHFCCSGTSCVNNVTCITQDNSLNCNDFDVNNIFVINHAFSNPIPTPCGGNMVIVSGDFVLPTCGTAACSIFRLSGDQTICEGFGTTIFGQVLDCNGLPVGNATVNFTVSDPSLGDVDPDTITTDPFGFFGIGFSSINGPGTVTVTGTVEGTSVMQNWIVNIDPCS